MAVKLRRLPYAPDALEPQLSARSVSVHYRDHHGGYVESLDALIAGTDYDSMPTTEIAAVACARGDDTILENAVQVINHDFYWDCMTPGDSMLRPGPLRDTIAREFGGLDTLLSEFRFSATTQFGSGWTWLVFDGISLRIIATGRLDTPILHGLTPLFGLDAWEHAYYADYSHRFDDYVNAWLHELLDWDAAGARFIEHQQAA
jgi:Fe-Mn family superoxide dismutase